MSSFNRRSLLLMPLALAACGFEPVYAPGGAGDTLNGRVKVSAPNSVESFLLVQSLERRLGRSATSTSDFALAVNVTTNTRAASITTSNETDRLNIDGRANFTLTSSDTGQVLASGQVSDFVSYSAAGSTVSALADERAARERLMVILSDQIVNRLYATPGLAS
ncbi:LPS assembly lipoprotein LptE [Ruegeria sp. HKCCD7255]|uniref:LPS assembly lipoprotein LptE n=1 Tax=Ruegeria sp. HKCCD7255 TaxID=2683004 RepID=UPI001489A852|nr:LPS assembly lipoprotein LptE [Ruegeria sp. HKCCD7255]